MPKEGTIAPKERVNIVYRPAQGEAQEERELPLKMLVLGDFTGKADPRAVEEREPVSVDKDNFNEVMKAHAVSLDLLVANRLSPDADASLQVQLRFESLECFTPQAILEQVPELKRLAELREALRSLKGPLANVPEFRRKIQELISDDAACRRLLPQTASQESGGEP
jgi:type VI secretion system protein ImpB